MSINFYDTVNESLGLSAAQQIIFFVLAGNFFTDKIFSMTFIFHNCFPFALPFVFIPNLLSVQYCEISVFHSEYSAKVFPARVTIVFLMSWPCSRSSKQREAKRKHPNLVKAESGVSFAPLLSAVSICWFWVLLINSWFPNSRFRFFAL